MAAASKPLLDLEVTIISAKDIKNVNWRNGPLQPYAVVYIDDEFNSLRSNLFITTTSDESLSTGPVWNETFSIQLMKPPPNCTLSIKIHHGHGNVLQDPLVGFATFPLSRLVPGPDSALLMLDLLRPSGRCHGKVLIKLALKERPCPPPPPPLPPAAGVGGSPHPVQDYQNAPAYTQFYNTAPPPPFPPPYHGRGYRESTPSPYGYYDQYGYYSHYPPSPPPPRPPTHPGLFVGPPHLWVSFSNYCQSSVPSAPSPTFSKPNSSSPGGSRVPSASLDYSLPPQPYSSTGSDLTGAMGGLTSEESTPSPYRYYDQYGYFSYYPPSSPPPRPPTYPGLFVGSPQLLVPSSNSSLPSVPSAPSTTFSKTNSSSPCGSGAPSASLDYSLPPQSYSRTGSELTGAMGGLTLEESSKE